jgi:hypothetical protein
MCRSRCDGQLPATRRKGQGDHVDELEDRRSRRGGTDAGPDGSPEQLVADRDTNAERHDAVADVHDDDATAADREAAARDRAAEERDIAANARDVESAFSAGTRVSPGNRGRARKDREEAARDREMAVDDRSRAQRDRQTSKRARDRASEDGDAARSGLAAIRLLVSAHEDSSEDMILIGRAQGLVMHARSLAPTQALLELCAQATQDAISLGEASRRITAQASP